MEKSEEVSKEPTTKQPTTTTTSDLSPEAELLYAELLSMGFDEAMCREAVKLTTSQDRAIELILKFQEDLEKGQWAPSKQNTTTTQTTQNPFEIPKMYESYKMVCLVRTDLNMGVGKIAAQVGHAVLGAYQNIISSNNLRWNEDLIKWEETGTAKIVLKVKSKEELEELYNRAKDNGLNAYIVADAGRTQIESGSLTVCAVGPASSVIIDQITGHLKLM